MKQLVTLIVCGLINSTALAAPEIQRFDTRNDVRVLFIQTDALPIVDIEVVFDAGSVRDTMQPFNQPGLALMTNALLTSGAGKLDADAIAETIDDLGARLGASANRDSASISLRSLNQRKTLNQAVDLLTIIITQPRFKETDFQREKNRLLVSLQAKQQRPGTLASDLFYQTLYADHPYGTLPEGNTESITAIQQTDLKKFYDQYYVAANAMIAIVGDISPRNARQLANTIAAKLPAGTAAAAIPEVEALDDSIQEQIVTETNQTHIRLGQTGIQRGADDYFNLYVGNHILGGGGFSARLMQEIRENRGLSYGVSSYFIPLRQPGPFLMAMSTRSDQAQQAIDILRAELARFVEQGPTAEELADAKANLTGGFPLRIDSNSELIGYLGMIGFYGLPLDYLETFTQKLDAITVESIQAAFRRQMNPDKLLQVTVGQD